MRPEMTTCPGALSLATTSSVGRATSVDDRLDGVAVETEHGSHSALPGTGHQLGAPRDESQGGRKLEHPGRDEGRVLADRVARDDRRRRIRGLDEGAERGDGRGEQARLGLAGVVESLRRAAPARVGHGPAEGGIGLDKCRRGGRGALGELAAHPERLRALRAEEQREGHRPASEVWSSRTTWPYSTASPVSATRWRTVPPRGARTSCRTPSISTCPSSSPLATSSPGPRPSA